FPIAVFGLLLFGLAVLSTASAPLAYRETGDAAYFLKRQLTNGVLPGVAAFLLASYFPYQRLKRFALPLMFVSLVLLFALFIPGLGVSVNEATRWLDIGPFSFQPAEIVKLTFIVYLAALFASRKEDVARVEGGLIPFLVVSGIVSALLVAQPNLGTLVIIGSAALAVYFAAGARLTHIAFVILLAALCFVAYIWTTGYKIDRLLTFVHPAAADTLGAGYHIGKTTLAIEAGGLFGLGFGSSQQTIGVYLPEPMGDSIFALIAAEFGFLGALGTLALFVVFAWYGLRIARSSPDMFGKLVACGIVSWIMVQSFVNIGSMSGLLPLTGVPLPFVSYGGSALVVVLTACGIMYNIQRTHRTSIVRDQKP
ncbi:MAG: putative peptidoglycan glycosyltransferase FtsW, partial [Patescibacteria group bacterium]